MYVGNLSYDVKYHDAIEFMRGGGWTRFNGLRFLFFFCGDGGGVSGSRPRLEFGPSEGKREPETGVKATGADGELTHSASECLLEEQGMGMD